MYETLRVLFAFPIVILVLGDWRTGKTDVSLLAGYLSKKWGLIDKIGSNIWTYRNPDVEYIITLGKLKNWLHADKSRKLFIFDEGLAHIPRRTAMSKMNVGILKMLAELSKGHGRMIVCSQIDKLDSDVLSPAFVRATWIKRSKKVMECYSKHHPPRTFRNLPKSPIRFDKDRMAEFIDRDMSKNGENRYMSQIHQVAQLYSEGISMSKIQSKLDVHPETVKRDIRKALKWFCEHYEESIEGTEAEIVNKENLSPFRKITPK